MASLLIVLAVVLTLLSIVAWMVVRLTAAGDASQVSLEWLDEFSPSKYSLMERLLFEGDYAFLATQPGYTPVIARRLKAERKRLFREYLRQLNRDFNRLTALAKLMVVYGENDNSELAAALWKHRILFYRGVVGIECRLALAPMGVSVSGVGQVVGAMAQMRNVVVNLVPANLMSSSSTTA